MPEQRETMDHLAQLVKTALEAADLSTYSELLDPDVHWGPPENTSACKNRRQVLTWYERGRDAGTRAHVSEVTVLGDRILVGLKVTNQKEASAGEADRWQVLSVRNGRIVEIVGYEDRHGALARALAADPPQNPSIDGG
jgi:ketosteroid isomerase-like protein